MKNQQCLYTTTLKSFQWSVWCLISRKLRKRFSRCFGCNLRGRPSTLQQYFEAYISSLRALTLRRRNFVTPSRENRSQTKASPPSLIRAPCLEISCLGALFFICIALYRRGICLKFHYHDFASPQRHVRSLCTQFARSRNVTKMAKPTCQK